ncbi:MAG: hypothetical protein ACYDEW_02905, partial [Vulcanimicrobiaceae bacterium]
MRGAQREHHGLAGQRGTLQPFARAGNRLVRGCGTQVRLQIARVDRTLAVAIGRSADAETEVFAILPIVCVVTTAMAGLGEIADLVLLEPGRFE